MSDNLPALTLYEPLALLIEQHKITQAQKIYEQALNVGLLGEATRQEDLKHEILSGLDETLQALADYVRGGDPIVWRNYLAQLSGELFQQNIQSLETMTQISRLLTANTKQLVEEHWPGPTDERQRQRFIRRLEGVDTLSQTTIIATGLKKDLDRSER